MQDELQAITIAGNPAYRIDPRSDDLFRRVIDLRNHVKAKLKKATGSEAERLDTEQQALKILANSTSYGIFVEFVVNSLDEPEARTCFGAGKPFRTSVSKAEAPGRYFYPLLATLITGAARLMLATAETLAAKRGLEWALCDTDSMALAMPAGMVQEEFLRRACKVRDWFTPLNPYGQKGPLFKIEDANYCTSTGQIAPLYCLAISAKRYVLFNLDAYGRPVVRKASAHGLGHLLAPYPEADAPKQIPSPSVSLAEIGVDRWQYDLWYQILTATLAGHPEQVDLTYHPNLSLPAASRYAATTPKLLRWFKAYNQNRPYPQQVKPFNFMLAFQAKPIPTPVQQPGTAGSRKACPVFKPIAPFNQDIQAASQNCFDRETGQPVPASALKSYRQVFASYHLSPESKFLNGDYFDRGPTQRRHIELVTVKYIGKEANKWEAQFHLGFDEDEQVEYGLASQGHRALCRAVSKAANDLKIGQRSLAEQLGVSRATLAKILCGKPVRLSRKTMVKLLRSIGGLRSHAVMASSLRKKAQS
ncbi:MAG TPA: hypothetical protein VJ728_06220 [Candidatus Binataceae bacterium]|nr:hypothetical protein [Candidatus Binataceae bacterium]